jgi:glucose-1-phosphate thymidylyltransferase
MWCVIPVAGRATRLAGPIAGQSEALLDIEGAPLLAHLLDRLGPPITDVCLVVGEGSEDIRRTFGRRWANGRIVYVVQAEPLGVAHAVGQARSVVTGPFLVLMGDSYFERPLVPAVEEWQASGADGAILVEPAGDQAGQPMGLVEASAGVVTRILKAPYAGQTDQRVSGAMILPPSFFDALDGIPPAAGGEYELEDAVAELMRRGVGFAPIEYRGWRRNVNTPGDLEVVRRRVAQRGGGSGTATPEA